MKLLLNNESRGEESKGEMFLYLSFHDCRITESWLWNPDDLDCDCQRLVSMDCLHYVELLFIIPDTKSLKLH